VAARARGPEALSRHLGVGVPSAPGIAIAAVGWTGREVVRGHPLPAGTLAGPTADARPSWKRVGKLYTPSLALSEIWLIQRLKYWHSDCSSGLCVALHG